MSPIHWYFDFISPFAYLQSERMEDIRQKSQVEARPILFAGLLNHWGQLGPAEIGPKRTFTYQHCLWMARRDGIEIKTPAAHPFNPLSYLRLAIALDNDWEAIQAIFRHIWQTGNDPADPNGLITLGSQLGLDDPMSAIQTGQVKSSLRQNTEQAIEAGVFGVPTFTIGEQLFWGYDATAMVRDYLNDPSWFHQSEFNEAASLPVGISRKKS